MPVPKAPTPGKIKCEAFNIFFLLFVIIGLIPIKFNTLLIDNIFPVP